MIGAAPIAIIGLGAISFFQWERFQGEFWIFGRYLDGAVLPVLAIGFAVFRPDIRLAAASIFLLAVGLLLAVMVPPGIEHDISDTISFWPQYVDQKRRLLHVDVASAQLRSRASRISAGGLPSG